MSIDDALQASDYKRPLGWPALPRGRFQHRFQRTSHHTVSAPIMREGLGVGVVLQE